MIVQRIVGGVAAAAAASAAAGVVIVAAAFAVFTLLETYVGPSGAAAIIAGVICCGLAGLGLVMRGGAKASEPEPVSAAEHTLPQRLFYMLQERPVVAAGMAVATGLIAWRNPRLAALASSLLTLTRDRA